MDQIRNLDESVFEEFKLYFEKISVSKFASNFPSTVALSQSFTISTNFIKNSIFDCAENDDLFAVKILFRSLIEHYLRFKFVWFHWIKFKTDDESKKYLEFTNAREILDTIKSEFDAYKLSNPEFKIGNWNEILNKIPLCENLTKKQIEEETLKYTYKNIIKLLKEIDSDKIESSLFASLILEYTKLSSFVHGGSASHNEIFKFGDEALRKRELERICSLSFQMAATVKLFSLILFIQTDKEDFEKSYLIIDQIIRKINID